MHNQYIRSGCFVLGRNNNVHLLNPNFEYIVCVLITVFYLLIKWQPSDISWQP